jgi:hypothetical protein
MQSKPNVSNSSLQALRQPLLQRGFDYTRLRIIKYMENNCQTLKNLNTRGNTWAVTAHSTAAQAGSISYPSIVYSLLSKNVCILSEGGFTNLRVHVTLIFPTRISRNAVLPNKL